MNWSDYEAAWKRQPLPVGAHADISALRASFEARSRKLRGALVVRDLSEASAGVFVMAAYAFLWWKIGRSGWPLAFAIALISSVTVFFLRERFRARNRRLGPDATMLAKVEADIAELRHQGRLLGSVQLWYLAPIAGAMAIQTVLIVHRAPPWDPVGEPIVIAGFTAFFAGVFGFAWAINRRALKKRVEPRILELEKLRRDLLAGN